MNLIEIYKELKEPTEKRYCYCDRRLFVCFYNGIIDLCTGKTSKDAESEFRRKHKIDINEEVIVPFRIRFRHDGIIDDMTNDLDTMLRDVEFICTKHTEYDFGYYSELLCNSSFWRLFNKLIKELGGLNIYCFNKYSAHYLQQALDANNKIILLV